MNKYLPGIFALVLAACAANTETYDQPARIVDPDSASRAGLQTALIEALGVPVTVSDMALTDNSLLVIENQPPVTMENPVPAGRVMELPMQFRLVRNGDNCILINQQDRKRYAVANTTCEPE